ncbi:MAG: uracil phosphoribosyltransferase, partial [Rhodothermales bacterium]
MKNVTVVDHPLLQRDLTILRNRTTSSDVFRRKMASVSVFLAYEAMRSLKLGRIAVQTPLEAAEGFVVDEDVLVVPILRAGLGFVQGFVDLVPEARVAHVGMQRDEASHEPEGYYSSIPSDIER